MSKDEMAAMCATAEANGMTFGNSQGPAGGRGGELMRMASPVVEAYDWGVDAATAPPTDWVSLPAGESVWYAFDYAGHGSKIQVNLQDVATSSVSPAWSPDGEYLAFLTDRTGEWEIWAMKADGSAQGPLFSTELKGLTLQYAFASERAIDWTR
jgi:hypothetical protein